MKLIAGSILVGSVLIARIINSSSVVNSPFPVYLWILFYVGIALMIWGLISVVKKKE